MMPKPDCDGCNGEKSAGKTHMRGRGGIRSVANLSNEEAPKTNPR
jgi:hypothetical protein